MLKWIRSLVGVQSSSRSRRVPTPREPLNYPEGDGAVPGYDLGEFGPKAQGPYSQRQQFRPVVRDAMTLPEMVGEWEKMNEALIQHVQYTQDKYLELQEMRTRIEER